MSGFEGTLAMKLDFVEQPTMVTSNNSSGNSDRNP